MATLRNIESWLNRHHYARPNHATVHPEQLLCNAQDRQRMEHIYIYIRGWSHITANNGFTTLASVYCLIAPDWTDIAPAQEKD